MTPQDQITALTEAQASFDANVMENQMLSNACAAAILILQSQIDVTPTPTDAISTTLENKLE